MPITDFVTLHKLFDFSDSQLSNQYNGYSTRIGWGFNVTLQVCTLENNTTNINCHFSRFRLEPSSGEIDTHRNKPFIVELVMWWWWVKNFDPNFPVPCSLSSHSNLLLYLGLLSWKFTYKETWGYHASLQCRGEHTRPGLGRRRTL